MLVSRFTLEGEAGGGRDRLPSDRDLIAVRVASPLVAKGRIAIELQISLRHRRSENSRLETPWRHQTKLEFDGSNTADFARTLDDDKYHVARLVPRRQAHRSGRT